MAINDLDSVFQKHQHCSSQLRINPNTNTYRLYCVEHKKWLHTLTAEEAEVYFKLLHQGELG
jgi:hypothetical protein